MATPLTGPLCPWNLLGLAFGLRPHAKMTPSVDEEMTCLSEGWNWSWVMRSLCPWSDLRRVGSF